MASVIKRTKMKAAAVAATLVWGKDDEAVTKWGYRINAEGDVDALVDSYGGDSSGSGRAALVNGKSLKGIGRTVLARQGYYGTGDLTLTEAIKEAEWLRRLNRHFPDAPNAYAVLKLDHKATINLSHLEQYIVDELPDERKYDDAAILVRDEPIRFEHFNGNGCTVQQNMAFLKEHYGVAPDMDDYEFTTMVINEVIRRRFYWFFRRVHFGGFSNDNIDLFGNPFDLPLTAQLPDFRNVHTCHHRVKVWSDENIMSHQSVAGAMATYCLPSDTPEQQNKAWDCTYNVIDKVNQRIFKEQALAMLGFSQDEIAFHAKESPSKVAVLGSAIIDALRQGTDIQDGFNQMPEEYTGEESLYRNVEFIGDVDFKTGFPMIVSGQSVGGYYLDRVAAAYRDLIQHNTLTDKRLVRCLAVCCGEVGSNE